LRVEYLEYLLEVGRAGSITAAAEKLYLRQSTLSAIISNLEDELDVKIFQRSRKGVTPTPDGELVLEFARKMTGIDAELRDKLSSKNSILRIINLITYPSASGLLCATLTKSLKENYPDRTFIMHDVPINKLLTKLSDGVANIAVGAYIAEMVDAHEGFFCERLFDDNFYLVVSKDSPYASRRRVNISDITGEHLVFAHYYPVVNDAIIRPVLRQFSDFTVLSTNEAIKMAVSKNNMIALMPGLALYNDIYYEQGTLRCIPLTGFQHKLINYLIYMPQLDSAEVFLLDEIRRIYAALPEKLVCPD